MPFDVFDAAEGGRGRKSHTMKITIDQYKRLYLNLPLQKELNCVKKPIKLFIGYDKVNKRLGLAKPEIVRLPGIQPVTFDARGYTSARGLITKHQLPTDRTYHYVFDGREGDWLTFRLMGYTAPDSRRVIRFEEK